ncbi:CbrC family protein [Cellulomonas denverensis]|uniref:Knr4/Smi1-like domain-containing protein n=1 Tax=Cellulomonas denverensis TaxID=264297 RepID=A0A7X6KTL6_9CELL|nr:CbrC family protein [Cellulomonas denverensis]NKY22066.1 hypothetical protein [Cellulomonas denverensis]GIG26173.1 hypothetical protein Cde04nite_24170 [Cellulomonas denverensis]
MAGARQEDLDRVERELGLPLPRTWRDQLSAENGFRWDDGAGVTGLVFRALPVRCGSDRKRMARTAQDIVWHTERARADGLPADALVIAVHDAVPQRIALRGGDDLWIQRGTGALEPLGVRVGEFAPGAEALPPVDELLPVFRFHPDPVGSGVLRRSPHTCPTCDRARGWEYLGLPFGRETLEHLCPWCIADGTAAARGASFVDDHSLLRGGVAVEVIAEVCDRTPGIPGYQQAEWPVCCGEAAVYVGPLDPEDVDAVGGAEREAVRAVIGHGGVAHRFTCQVCGSERWWLDLP